MVGIFDVGYNGFAGAVVFPIRLEQARIKILVFAKAMQAGKYYSRAFLKRQGKGSSQCQGFAAPRFTGPNKLGRRIPMHEDDHCIGGEKYKVIVERRARHCQGPLFAHTIEGFS